MHNSKNTYLATLGATFISHRVWQGIYVHNSRKSQLYTYLGVGGHLVLPSSVPEFDEYARNSQRYTYHKFPKIRPPPFAYYFEAKVGRGLLLEMFVLCICPLPRSSQSLIHKRSTIGAFLNNGSFTERVLWDISNAFVDTKPRGIKATCIILVTCDNLT